MKKIISLCIVVLMTTAAFAQQQLATLLHNDSITVFYGVNALRSAHAAAVNGDAITLSEGTFNSVNITKAVTIRGAGMFVDTTARTMPTILQGEFHIDVPQDSTYWLTLEGLYHYQYILYKTAYNPLFMKCKFKKFQADINTTGMSNARFINCIIEEWHNCTNNSVWRATGTQFINCAILSTTDESPDRLVNCVAYVYPYNATSKTIINSVVYYNGGTTGNGSNNSYSSFNSIGIHIKGNNYYDLSVVSGNNLWNYTTFNQVFKTFNGTYSDGINFELKDDIAASRLGTDGTQVGIYGGQCPFDPSVRNPLIGHATVGRTTTSDGKLEVEVQVFSESDNQ